MPALEQRDRRCSQLCQSVVTLGEIRRIQALISLEVLKSWVKTLTLNVASVYGTN